MSEKAASEITRILQDWNDGNEAAKEELLPYVYDELKRQARVLMSRGACQPYAPTYRPRPRSIYQIKPSDGNRLEKPKPFLRHRLAIDAADPDRSRSAACDSKKR